MWKKSAIAAAVVLGISVVTPAHAGPKSDGDHGAEGMQGEPHDMMEDMMQAHAARGATLKFEMEGKGREIEFECWAPMNECLEAFDRIRETLRNRRGGSNGSD